MHHTQDLKTANVIDQLRSFSDSSTGKAQTAIARLKSERKSGAEVRRASHRKARISQLEKALGGPLRCKHPSVQPTRTRKAAPLAARTSTTISMKKLIWFSWNMPYRAPVGERPSVVFYSN